MKFGKDGMESEMWASDTILFWLVFGLVLAFVAITFVVIISKSGAEKSRIYENLESLNLMQRFIKSPTCFIYEKERVILTDVIDYDKFSEQRLNNCYSLPSINQNTFPAFKITLNSVTGTVSKNIKTSNWNDNRPFEEKKTPKNVLIYINDKFENGFMEIEVQNLK